MTETGLAALFALLIVSRYAADALFWALGLCTVLLLGRSFAAWGRHKYGEGYSDGYDDCVVGVERQDEEEAARQ